MKRSFLSILIVVLSFVSIQAFPIIPLDSEKTKTPWAYIISTPEGGTRVTTEENGTTITHNYAKTELYTLKTSTEGLRFTVVETNQYDRQTNGFCYFVLGEFTVLDANGNPIEYTVTSNADHNEYNSPDGAGLPALNDGVLNNYFHSNYSSSNAPYAYHYIELTFEQPISSFSLEWYGRPNLSAHEFSPTLCGITPKGYEFTEDMLFNNGIDDEENDSIYNTYDVFTDSCLFVSLTNGGIDAFPLKTIAKEQYKSKDTLYIPLKSGNTIKYHASEYTSISNDIPELPYFTSYKFNNKYNANLNTDVVADCKDETIEITLNAIGKSLAASFQLSEERAVAYIGNKLQISKETRNRFADDVKYIVTYPGYNLIQNVKIQDEIWSNGENSITEIPLTEDMISSNKPAASGNSLGNMLDGDPNTIFHTQYGASFDPSVIPYITITLDEAVSSLQFYYQTRNTGNYNPTQLNLYVSNDGNDWQLKKAFTCEDDELPEYTGAEYTSPTIELGNRYKYIKIEQTASKYHNNHMVFAEFRLYEVIKGSGEIVKIQDAVYKDVKIPFGRTYTVKTKWLTDIGDVPRIDIDMVHSASSINKQTYLNAKFTISGFGVYDDFEDSVQIKGRGNSTWGYAKKPYRLKFASKVKPFGLTKGKSWVLLANAQRGALMANAIAMKVGQLTNAPYTNHIIPVELYINGEYKGNYMFTEHLGMSNNSVDIDEDLGYMLELDDYYDEDFKFRSNNYNLPVNIKDPDLLDFSEEERNMKFNIIQADFQQFEDALYNNEEISKYLDLDAAARFLLVNELVLNMELCHPKSTYLWKGDMYSSESKITFGPLWDFDWAFGYQKTGSYFDVDYKTQLLSMATHGRNFFQALMNHEEFQKHYYKVWTEFTENGYIKEIKEFISDYYTFVEPSLMNNGDIWGDGYDYGSKIKTMQNWMQRRHDYIATNLKKYDITDLIHNIVGDIDCNDLLTIHDVALLADYLIGKTDENFNTGKADIDNNDNIDNSDLKMTVNLVANSDPIPPMYYYNTPLSDATITATNETGNSGNINIPIYLQNNEEGIKAIQADIAVPSNIWIENISAKNKANGDTVVYAQIASELYRVVAFNKNGKPFAGDTPVFDIELSNDGYTASEACVATIKDILVVDSDNLEKRIKDTQFTIEESDNYSITYMVDGEIYKVVTLEKGNNITPIEEPVKTGYTFSGWSEIPETMPSNNIVIEGTFTVNYYKVTYVVDGEIFATNSIAYGATIILMEEPVKTGYTFSGWSEAPETMPAEDIIITGAFTVNYYKVTYIVDGETYATDSIAYGAEITLIDSPEKEGYTFSGWSDVPETMPAEDIIITGALVNTNISIISTDATIKINGNCITLVNANNCNVAIYSAEGVLVEKIDNYSGEEIMLDNGIYIVRIKNKTVKIKI